MVQKWEILMQNKTTLLQTINSLLEGVIIFSNDGDNWDTIANKISKSLLGDISDVS